MFSISRPRPNIIPVYEFKHIGKIKINWKAKCLRSQFSDVRMQSRDLETVKVHFSNRIVKRIPHDNRYTSNGPKCGKEDDEETAKASLRMKKIVRSRGIKNTSSLNISPIVPFAARCF